MSSLPQLRRRVVQSTAKVDSLLTADSPGSGGQDSVVDTICVGSFTPSVVLDLARSTGALERHGLAVKEEPVASSPAQFRALAEGGLHVGLTSPDNVIAYRFSPGNPLGRTLDARILSAVDRGMGLGLYSRRGAGAADLRGARVGVDVPTSGFALALYELADRLGVGREDYELVALGSTPKRLAALLAGECDATMLNAGNELVAEAAGHQCLAGVGDTLAPYLGTVVAVVGDRWVEVARRFAAALTDTVAQVAAGRFDAPAAEAARRRLDLEPALAERYVERLRSRQDGVVADGVVDRRALETLVRLRSRWLPESLPGDLAAEALTEGSGLVDGG
jgi:ABC-type nitrate/sulfonate/bicarbonate transport system substrate-binding protein